MARRAGFQQRVFVLTTVSDINSINEQEIGAGTEIMRPLALTVTGGLLISALLTLALIPCLYLIVNALSEPIRDALVGDAGRAPGR